MPVFRSRNLTPTLLYTWNDLISIIKLELSKHPNAIFNLPCAASHAIIQLISEVRFTNLVLMV
jgi:hypothetical protein